MSDKDTKDDKDKAQDDDGKDEGKDDGKDTDDASGGDDKPKDGGKKDKDSKPKFTPEQQKEVDAIIKDRLEREKRKSEETAEKVKEEARVAALEQQGEFKALADERQIKIAELTVEVESATTKLEEATVRADAAEKAIAAQVKAQIAELPDHIKDAIEPMTPLEQLTFIGKHSETLFPGTKPVGIPPTPRPSEGGGPRGAPKKVSREEIIANSEPTG